jgi:hypothetical protein
LSNCAFTGALTRAGSPWACCQVDVAEVAVGDGVAAGEAAPVGDGLAAGLADALDEEADGDGLADGVAAGLFGAISSTWRNWSSAVRLTFATTA